MPPTPWKPLVVFSSVIGPTGSILREIRELAGHPGLHGVVFSNIALDHVVAEAMRKARLALYAKPSELYEWNVPRWAEACEKYYIRGLAVSAAEDPKAIQALSELMMPAQVLLSTQSTSYREDGYTPFDSIAVRYAFDGAMFPDGRDRPLTARAQMGHNKPMRCIGIKKPEEAPSAFKRGATHLLVSSGIFTPTRVTLDHWWKTIKDLKPGRQR